MFREPLLVWMGMEELVRGAGVEGVVRVLVVVGSCQKCCSVVLEALNFGQDRSFADIVRVFTGTLYAEVATTPSAFITMGPRLFSVVLQVEHCSPPGPQIGRAFGHCVQPHGGQQRWHLFSIPVCCAQMEPWSGSESVWALGCVCACAGCVVCGCLCFAQASYH